jgi:hypothetical protein
MLNHSIESSEDWPSVGRTFSVEISIQGMTGEQLEKLTEYIEKFVREG